MALTRGLLALAPKFLGSSSAACLLPLAGVGTHASAGAGMSEQLKQLFRAYHPAPANAVTPASAPKALSPCDQLSQTPSSHIKYDEHHHERYPPSTDNKSWAYLVMTSGRFLYASAARLALLKFVVSLSASADVLAMASLEVDLSNIEEGQTVTVKWRGKPVFIKFRTDEEIAVANSTPLTELRDPQTDSERALNPKYLVVVGVCTHLGCVPIAGAGDYSGWFCPCHGSHYDLSGRIRKGPAPYNLEVPEYKYMEDNKMIIG